MSMPSDEHGVEIVCPGGSWSQIDEAIKCGATAIYVGLCGASARPDQYSFTTKQIASIRQLTRGTIRLYVAINNPVEPSREQYILKSLSELDSLGIDAFVVSDWGLLAHARSEGISTPIHLSCLAGIHNSLAVDVAYEAGVRRIVLNTNLTQADIMALREQCTTMTFEIIAAGGICLFDCYRCRLPHNVICGQYTTVCSRLIEVMDGVSNIKTYNKPRSINVDILWCAQCGISALKIEGRSRPAAHIAESVKKLRRGLQDGRSSSHSVCDPYKMVPRLVEIGVPQNSASDFSTRPRPDVCEVLQRLLQCGAIGSATRFWCLPLGPLGIRKDIFCWEGLVINDLAGPPFSHIDSMWNSLQWASPLYVLESGLTATLQRMAEVAGDPRVRILRIHDIGLLRCARILTEGTPIDIMWDRFGWPARVPVPLHMTEEFVRKQGAAIIEYGADQDFSLYAKPTCEHALLAVSGRVAAVIPPYARSEIMEGCIVRFSSEDGIYDSTSGLLVERYVDVPVENREIRLPLAASVTVGVMGDEDASHVEEFIRNLREGRQRMAQ